MKGIYKFTNKITKQSYIGQSINLEERYKTHKNQHKNLNHHNANSNFYKALREYGFDNFTYEILEQNNSFTREDLDKLEIYYIDQYDSFVNGYNMNKGGNFTSSIKTLTDKDVIIIKDRLQNSNESASNIAKEFNVAESTISAINHGKMWVDIGNYNYPIRKIDKGIGSRGQLNSHAKVTDEMVISIRKLFVNHSLPEIYELYKDILSFSGLKKIVYGVTFTHLPIYKKRERKWINC